MKAPNVPGYFFDATCLCSVLFKRLAPFGSTSGAITLAAIGHALLYSFRSIDVPSMYGSPRETLRWANGFCPGGTKTIHPRIILALKGSKPWAEF